MDLPAPVPLYEAALDRLRTRIERYIAATTTFADGLEREASEAALTIPCHYHKAPIGEACPNREGSCGHRMNKLVRDLSRAAQREAA